MLTFLIVLAAALTIAAAALAVKLAIIKKNISEITHAFDECVCEDTNALITVSGGDRTIRRLASDINKNLIILKNLRYKYVSGDREIKDCVTNLSHDLRTPVTAAHSYIELLNRENLPPQAREYLKIVSGRIDAIKTLSEELFRYSMIVTAERGERESLNLNRQLIASLADFYGAFKQKNITPEINICNAQVFRELNKNSLHRIFGNILNNAVKYSAGDLSVNMDERGVIVFKNKAEGLDNINANRLFDRFFTVESTRASHGLGLSIAKILTENMGGSIIARFDEGCLTIRLEFPAQ